MNIFLFKIVLKVLVNTVIKREINEKRVKLLLFSGRMVLQC